VYTFQFVLLNASDGNNNYEIPKAHGKVVLPLIVLRRLNSVDKTDNFKLSGKQKRALPEQLARNSQTDGNEKGPEIPPALLNLFFE